MAKDVKSGTVIVEKVLYPPESETSGPGWRLVIMKAADGMVVKGTGNWPAHPLPGVAYDVTYIDSHHPRHGYSWEIQRARLAADVSTVDGLTTLIAALRVPLIGEGRARAIANLAMASEEDPLGWLGDPDNAPLLVQLPGVSEISAAEVQQKITETTERARLFLELADALPGVRAWIVDDAIDRWTDEAKARILADPYCLLEISGIGWKRADPIATDVLGLPADDLRRIRAASRRAISDAAHTGGHTICTDSEYRTALVDLLDHSGVADHPEATPEANRLERIGEYIGSPRHVEAERDIADQIRRRRNTSEAPTLPPREIPGAGADQQAAYDLIREHPTALLVGGPGTGKTWLLAHIVSAARAEGIGVRLCAPTGKAARRMTEALRENGVDGLQARTIHSHLGPRLFGASVQDEYGTEVPLPGGLWIVDEASMADAVLFATLITEIPVDAKVLIVGDDGQLPSVDPGAVLRDLIASGGVPCARLIEIRRNSGAIPLACADVREGALPIGHFELVGNLSAERNLGLIETDDVAGWLPRVFGLAKYLGFDPLRDMQVVAAQKAGRDGIASANSILQDLAHPDVAGEPETGFRGGDRIVVGVNGRYGGGGRDGVPLVNGEIGYVVETRKSSIVFDFSESGSAPRLEIALRDVHRGRFQLAYALTVHKMQGSGAPLVVYLASRSHAFSTRRELIYTALSRAERMCVVVGSYETLERGVRRRAGDRRTLLQGLLTGKGVGV